MAPGAAARRRGGLLADFAVRADQRADGIQWSYRRSLGGVRIVVIDSRSRVFTDGRRLMVGETEWQWITESVAGDWNHVVLASSLPPLLPHGIHALEAWNEAVCGGAWGKSAAAGRRADTPRCGPGALGGVRRVVHRVRAAPNRAGHWGAGPPAGLGCRPGRRHPPQLPGRRGLPGRDQPAQRRLPGGLLADPQRAPAEASGGARSCSGRRRAAWPATPWPGWPGCACRGSAGGPPTARGSTTCCPRWNTRAPGHASASTAPSATRPASRTCRACAKRT